MIKEKEKCILQEDDEGEEKLEEFRVGKNFRIFIDLVIFPKSSGIQRYSLGARMFSCYKDIFFIWHRKLLLIFLHNQTMLYFIIIGIQLPVF